MKKTITKYREGEFLIFKISGLITIEQADELKKAIEQLTTKPFLVTFQDLEMISNIESVEVVEDEI